MLWEHRLISAKSLYAMNDGDQCYALSIESDRAVYYSEDESYASLCLLFCHEQHHLPSMIPGEIHALKKFYGEDDFDDREESAATYYGTVFYEGAGEYLRLPKPPKKHK